MGDWGNAAGGAATGASAGAVLGPWGAVAGGVIGGALGYFSGDDQATKDEAARKKALYAQGNAAGNEADQAQASYNSLGARGNGSLDALEATANGKNSVSALQLQQGLQQNLAAQRAQVASASPQNAAMAARTGAIQSARLGYGLTGQQAVAGLQERNQAQAQYANLLQGLRGQDAQMTIGNRTAAMSAYNANNSGAPAPSWAQQWGPPIMAGLQAYSQAKSDRRLKTDIEDGDEAADGALKGLKAYFYRYKDEKHGEGPRPGVMAQDLEKAGLGHTVINTPSGKAIHGGHLATALAAMLPGIDKRISALEGH